MSCSEAQILGPDKVWDTLWLLTLRQLGCLLPIWGYYCFFAKEDNASFFLAPGNGRHNLEILNLSPFCCLLYQGLSPIWGLLQGDTTSQDPSSLCKPKGSGVHNSRLPLPHSWVPATFWSLGFHYFEDINVNSMHKAVKPPSDQSLRNPQRLPERGKRQVRVFLFFFQGVFKIASEESAHGKKRDCPVLSRLLSVTVSYSTWTVRAGTRVYVFSCGTRVSTW